MNAVRRDRRRDGRYAAMAIAERHGDRPSPACSPTRRCKPKRSVRRRPTAATPGRVARVRRARPRRSGCAASTPTTRSPPSGTWTGTARPASSSARSPSPRAQWADENPLAQMRDPITLEDHQASRWVVRAAAPARLLPGLQRRHRRGRHRRRTRARPRAAAGAPVGLGAGAPRPPHGARQRVRADAPARRSSGPTAMKMAGITPGRRRRVPDLRLLHVHGRWSRWRTTASAPRARAARSPRAARSAPAARCRPTPAAGSCPRYYMWGMTPAVGGRDPGARRRAASARSTAQRRGARQRQRRHPRPPRDARPQPAREGRPERRTSACCGGTAAPTRSSTARPTAGW